MLDRILSSIARNPTIGVVGISSRDTMLAVETMPEPGGFALVEERFELPGGTSANAAVAAATLGARVDFISTVGDDFAGRSLLETIGHSGIDTGRVRIAADQPTDQTTVVTSRRPPNRTIFWRQGAYPRMGDRIDIDRLFTRNLVVLDSVDPALRRFLIDLPVHTYPDVRILTPLTYVVDFPGPDELESVMRCDALVGSEQELVTLMQADSRSAAISEMQERMRVSNVRCAAVTLGADGALAFDERQVFEVPPISVEVVDTTGAGDAFAGAFAVGLASRLELREALMLANCVAGLSTRSLGAQTALPTPEELEPALRFALDQARS